MSNTVRIDFSKPPPISNREPGARSAPPWKEKRWKADKEKLMRDAVNVLKFLKQITSQMRDDLILIKRSRIIEAIKEPANKGITALQERADLAMRNFGFEKSWNPESRSIFYIVPRQMVEELCKAYAADLQKSGL